MGDSISLLSAYRNMCNWLNDFRFLGRIITLLLLDEIQFLKKSKSLIAITLVSGNCLLSIK